jgi:hypothetical protein
MPTTTTTISRSLLIFPDRGHDGTTQLEDRVKAYLSKLGDNANSRFFFENDLANSASVDFEHNFKCSFADLAINMYQRNEGTGELTRLTEATTPKRSEFTIAAKGGSETTHITVTNNTGGEEDIALTVEQHVPHYVGIFNATTDWGSAAGGFYTITVTAAMHGKGVSPMVQTYKKSGTDYDKNEPDRVRVSSTGSVAIRVDEAPDLRFEGKIIIS